MKAELKSSIIRLLDGHRIMIIATNRSDGWPPATTVGYVNVGLVLYCFVNQLSQKYDNIIHDPRVSIAIASDFPILAISRAFPSEERQNRLWITSSIGEFMRCFSGGFRNTRHGQSHIPRSRHCCVSHRRSFRSSITQKNSAIAISLPSLRMT